MDVEIGDTDRPEQMPLFRMTEKKVNDQAESLSQQRADTPPIYDSATIFQGRKEVWIEHGETMYRLRLTASGRLYLTK